MKVWVTKYALTSGIQEMDVEDCGNGMVKGPSNWDYYHGEGRQWHKSKESAIARAEDMRLAKLASLRKSIAKMNALTF